MTVLIAPGTTAATSAQKFTPGPGRCCLYITPAIGTAETTSSNTIFIERERADGSWQRVLVLTGEGNGDGGVFLGQGTFRGNRPAQGSPTGLDITGDFTLS